VCPSWEEVIVVRSGGCLLCWIVIVEHDYMYPSWWWSEGAGTVKDGRDRRGQVRIKATAGYQAEISCVLERVVRNDVVMGQMCD